MIRWSGRRPVNREGRGTRPPGPVSKFAQSCLLVQLTQLYKLVHGCGIIIYKNNICAVINCSVAEVVCERMDKCHKEGSIKCLARSRRPNTVQY